MDEEHKTGIDSIIDAATANDSKQAQSTPPDNNGDTETLNTIKDLLNDEHETPNARKQKIRISQVIGGDFLTSKSLLKYKYLFLEILLFCIIYISMRYKMQNDMLEIKQLEDQCEVIRNMSTTASARLTEQCRQSRIEEKLRAIGDSTLTVSTSPIYKLKINDTETE